MPGEIDLEGRLGKLQSLAEIGRMTAGVAHDSNNFLTAIIGEAQEIIESESREGIVRSATTIINHCLRMSSMYQDVLRQGRKNKNNTEPSNINHLVDKYKSLIKKVSSVRRSKKPDIEIVYDLRSSWTVNIDESRFENIFLNLGINAADAMPDGGTLTYQTQDIVLESALDEIKTGKYVLFEVEDTGDGIREDILPRIFEPFFTTKQDIGTGLGLARVKQFVDNFGGYLRVQSTVGVGTKFQIYLPARDIVLSPRATIDGTTGALTGSESVLFVEDDNAVRLITAKGLRRLGYTVYDLSSAYRAETIVSDHPIDILITDMIMEGVRGDELAGSLLEERPSMEVLLISGYAESELFDRGSGYHFLQKPFTLDGLAAKIRGIFEYDLVSIP